MDTESIIAELEAERDRLDEAIAALEAGWRTRTVNGRRRRRQLSAAERKRISEGMKKRWAARKKKAAT